MDSSEVMALEDSVELTGRRFPDGAAVLVRAAEGQVAAVQPLDSLDEPPGVQRWLVPGFFDLQLNGFAGREFIDPRVTVPDVEHIVRAAFGAGTTRFLATLVTASMDVLCGQLAVIAEAMERVPIVKAVCVGVHLEGPFLHPDDGPRGAHPREHVRDPNIADYERLARAARGKIALMTLAPERPGAVELIRHATAQGVLVALGHHRADGEAVEAAIAAGARMSTHLGNGCDALLPRHDNYIWTQLAEDRLWASFITDGQHLPPAAVRCMLRAKTLARSVLITDAVGLAGLPPGKYHRGGLEIERLVTGRIVMSGTPYLAGSSADMPTVVGRAIIDGGLSLVEAVRLAAIQPAALLSGGQAGWVCAPGQPANLVELDWRADDEQMIVRQVAAWGFASHTGAREGQLP